MRIVLGAIEEEMLEQMGKPGAASALVARAYMIPEVHRDDRNAAVLVHQKRQPVLQHELPMGNAEPIAVKFHRRCCRWIAGSRLRNKPRSIDQQDRYRCHQQSHAGGSNVGHWH